MAKNNNLSAPQFHDPEKARQYLERTVWPYGPVCPHCGTVGDHYELKGKSTRPGLYKCHMCREPFTVTVGTVFERSKIPLNKWLMAVYLLCSSKKGMSSHQLHRTLGVTYKTAWFMTHRIREAMKTDPSGLLGSGGGTVEADETFWLNSKRSKKGREYKGRGFKHKEKILALVERGGQVRSFHIPEVNASNLRPVLKAQMARDAHLMTDEHQSYKAFGHLFASHQHVKHGQGEYVRGNVHTNTVEGYFSLLKRGLIGTYHHCSAKHLQRYVTEFDFRYNNRSRLGIEDKERADIALQGIVGKRLTYRRTDPKTAEAPKA
ncbi:transposase [Sulfurifustis variabilis]|uniref:Transposase n=1 Tax=Sulfurifustis variabilis TaxID=1675686 RepID=A0A1B4V1K5_9GAMM|nr:IS1595 family transposase [Sulfurifustis variabilis]BAU47360.1 transposase [Sulfurifustis variabilis]